MLKKLDHVNMVVSNLEKATDFFSRLGFVVEHRGDLKGEWIASIVNLNQVNASYVRMSFQDSDVSIELIQYFLPPSTRETGIAIPNQIGIRHIAFEVEDIDAIVPSLANDGVSFFGDVQTYPETGKRLVYFYGPDDIILEFAEYPSK